MSDVDYTGIEYSSDEMMTVAAARMMRNGASCFVGIGLPSAAANLARLTHAPDTVLIYESGCIGTKPECAAVVNRRLESFLETADTVVSIVEIFTYWLQGGRIDLGFQGARRRIDLVRQYQQLDCDSATTTVQRLGCRARVVHRRLRRTVAKCLLRCGKPNGRSWRSWISKLPADTWKAE